jgi:hypothetical protein
MIDAARIEALAQELTVQDLREIARKKDAFFTINALKGRFVEGQRPITVPADGHPLLTSAQIVADKRGHTRTSTRWWEVHNIALRLLREASVAGQAHAYRVILERIAGMIEPGAHETPYGRGQLDLAETIQNFIDNDLPNIEPYDEYPPEPDDGE